MQGAGMSIPRIPGPTRAPSKAKPFRRPALAFAWGCAAAVAGFLAAPPVVFSMAVLWNSKIEYIDKLAEVAVYLGASAVLGFFSLIAWTISHRITSKAGDQAGA